MSYMNSDHLRFYIENFSDLKLTEKLISQCKDELPRKVAHILYSEAFNELKTQLKGIEYCELNEPNVWWAGSDFYDYDTEKGLYFGLEGLAEGLDAPNNSPDAPYFYLYWDQPGRRKRGAIDVHILSLLIRSFSDVSEMPFRAGSGHLKDDGYLALMPLGNIINIETLKDPKSLTSAVKESALYFTSELLGLLDQSRR
ncbi:MAG: hypothetical protein LPK88_12305 [Alphaproteobacteria bacterium]|nr:hypothetical protein [Alphaproteobacteria bacterium]MDX5417081.1 hypothetical protein [Alphaproteobacteria bacterium]MDX5494494.1 hypothetical protein [Alphaproteobacteria bacterium]